MTPGPMPTLADLLARAASFPPPIPRMVVLVPPGQTTDVIELPPGARRVLDGLPVYVSSYVDRPRLVPAEAVEGGGRRLLAGRPILTEGK